MVGEVINISNSLVFFVNGRKVVDDNVDPECTLLTYLRTKLQLPGTKLGCGEGGCGACTVMVSKIDRDTGQISHYSINACLAPVATLHGMAVTTVEGIGSTKTRLHPVQERIAKTHGSQCGFCTPGIVMSMYTLLRNHPVPTMQQIEENFTGNLCRCTGYRPILEGYRTFTKEGQMENGNGGCGKVNCCRLKNSEEQTNELNGNDTEDRSVTTVLFDARDFIPYDPTQEVIFPPELKINGEYDREDLRLVGPRVTFLRPTSLSRLLQMKTDHPLAKIIVGNTEVGVEVKFKHQLYPVLINPTSVVEMTSITIIDTGLKIGASVSLSTIEDVLIEQVKLLPEHKTRVFTAILEMLRWFAGRQIRNAAAIGGNIMTGSPISDLNPVLMAAKVTLSLHSLGNGERKVTMDEHFFTGYRRNIVKPDEVLTAIYIPYTQEDTYVIAYKQARRRDDDIAIVNCGMSVTFRPSTIIVDEATLVYGGVAPTTIMATTTMKNLKGKVWATTLLEESSNLLLEDLPLDPSAPGGMVDYRKALTLSFFFKFYLTIQDHLSAKMPHLINQLSDTEKSVTQSYQRPPTSSTQLFQRVPSGQAPIDPIGRPIKHVAAEQQATGEALYVDDMPAFKNELNAAIIYSSRAHANILSIDISKANKLEGVHSIITAKDLSADSLRTGPIFMFQDEEVFASDKVSHIGQPIGVVLAENQAIAQRAARLVDIKYQDIKPLIITIKDAIDNKSYFHTMKIHKGDVDGGFQQADHILEGEVHIGGQEHFYMETNSHIVIPRENGELEIFSSTQNPTGTQRQVAQVVGVPSHKITCRTKRLGGGFGGKETRTCVCVVPIAVGAVRTNRPVRIMLDRDEDMISTGTRHPFLGRWKVGYNKAGIIMALSVELYSNAGYSTDLSIGVMERALFSFDNAYRLPNVEIVGTICKTNLPSNTAFRGFGGPQGMMVIEDMMTSIAQTLQINPNLVRERNMYHEWGDVTPFGQHIHRCTVRRCWDEVLSQSHYQELVKEIDVFNSTNTYRKRGISAIPIKFGISFTVTTLNQGGALLLVYTDGSVLLSHGGTEMGQGLHTKMIQVAARGLGISCDKIHIAETSTDKVPNTSPTAASASSDLFGGAVKNACEIISERLEPFRSKAPKGTWEDWVKAAYVARVSLSTTGFYKTPGLVNFDWDTGIGNPFDYFCFGSAVSVVEIDCLTGDHTVLQTDIVMDVGSSLNPAVDIGQIEGAFMQGLGLFTLEELLYTPEGALLTRGPGAYKIPGFQDIPCKFNVSLLRDAPNPRAVYSSKAVGEPPLFSAASVFYAIKNAITAARGERGTITTFRMDSPATAERIRMACQDTITDKVPPVEPGSYKPWAIRP